MNKFIGIGNLTKAPELHETEKGKVGKFTIAINGFNRTDYINITTFGAVAENCKKYLEKGKKVAVVGAVQTREYEKDGKKQYFTEVVASEVEFLGERPKELINETKTEVDVDLTPIPDTELPF